MQHILTDEELKTLQESSARARETANAEAWNELRNIFVEEGSKIFNRRGSELGEEVYPTIYAREVRRFLKAVEERIKSKPTTIKS